MWMKSPEAGFVSRPVVYSELPLGLHLQNSVTTASCWISPALDSFVYPLFFSRVYPASPVPCRCRVCRVDTLLYTPGTNQHVSHYAWVVR